MESRSWLRRCFIVASVVVYLHVMITMGSEPNMWCTVIEDDFFTAENRVLKFFAYDSVTPVSHFDCKRECRAQRQCVSINYRAFNQVCELNNATRVQHAKAFTEERGSMYSDKDSATVLMSINYPASCKELLAVGHSKSDVYIISPANIPWGLQVYCDMVTDGGGWIGIQRRLDGTVNFNRTWSDYQSGFGDLYGEFWLGNDNLVALTSSGDSWRLRFDLEDWEENTTWAEYSGVHINSQGYRLSFNSYIPGGTAGDALLRHNGHLFSTEDNDNDDALNMNCADHYKGGWWFKHCFVAHLNGQYYHLGQSQNYQGILWQTWKSESLKSCTMKIRE